MAQEEAVQIGNESYDSVRQQGEMAVERVVLDNRGRWLQEIAARKSNTRQQGKTAARDGSVIGSSKRWNQKTAGSANRGNGCKKWWHNTAGRDDRGMAVREGRMSW